MLQGEPAQSRLLAEDRPPGQAEFTELMLRACNYTVEGTSPSVEDLA